MDHLGAGPERDHHPGACRAEPELLAQDLHVPAGRYRPGELHRAASVGTGRAARACSLRLRCGVLRVRWCGRDGGEGEDSGQTQRQQVLFSAGAGGAEPVRRDGHPYRLMRPGRVVFAHPRIDRGLRGGQISEGDGVIEELAARLPWNRSIFPVVVGERGWVSRWMIPLSRQIRSNSTSPPLPKRSVNCLPSSDKNLVRDAELAQRRGEGQADRSSGAPGHHRGDHAIPGMIIDPGHDLGLGPVSQERPADDVQLPQRHRLIAFPPQIAVLGRLRGPGSISPCRTRTR